MRRVDDDVGEGRGREAGALPPLTPEEMNGLLNGFREFPPLFGVLLSLRFILLHRDPSEV